MHSRLFSVLLLGFVTAGTGVTLAHHSYADFDREKTVSVEGRLEELKLVNPHGILMVRTDEGTLITAEWGNVTMLVRTGFTAGMLNVGDRVTLTGCLTKNPELHRMSLLTQIVRPRDGWQWTRNGVVAGP